jgi:Ca2+-binding EF-hand superfamily protein
VIDFRIINNYIENIKKYKQSNIFQEIAITYLIHNADLDEVMDAYKLFNQFDVDRNGKITLSEFYRGLCKASGNKLNKEEITEVFYNIDSNRNNYIEQEEFVKAAIDKKIFLSDKMLKFAFNFFDKDKNGSISVEEIEDLFKDNTTYVNDDKALSSELKKIIEKLDKDKDGLIDFKDFSSFMKSLLEKI